MGFFKSEKGSIISDMFMLIEDHVGMKSGLMYEVIAYEDHVQIKQKVGGKAEASLNYGKITDVFYGTYTEIKEKKQSPIGRALVGGMLFGGAGAIVGAVSAGTKEKKKTKFHFVISYTSSSGEEKYIQFEDTRLYKGAKVAATIKKLSKIEDAPSGVIEL